MKFKYKVILILLVLFLTVGYVSAAENDTSINIEDATVIEGSGDNFTGTFLDDNNNPIVGHHLFINLTRSSSGASKTYELVSDYKGEFQIPIFLGKGTYTAQVSFPGITVGTTTYNPSTSDKVNINVVEAIDERIETVIDVNDFEETYGEGLSFTGILKEAEGVVLSGHHVNVNLSRSSGASKKYDVVTDYTGTFSLPINLAVGNYYALVTYDGTSTYQPSYSNTVNIIVKNKETNNTNSSSYNVDILTEKLSINMSNWNYDSSNDIYYQLGLVYCVDPATTTYESLGIYVPGEYMNGVVNSNGKYTCTVNNVNSVGNYTADTAPIVIPVNTAGYSAQAAPTSYNSNTVKVYINEGFIYVYPGCRGRDNGADYSGGAPWGVTDLKAAVTYIKFNNDTLPGDAGKIFTFGHSGGGAQSSLMGATGDSDLYTPYLESIGAALVDKNGNAISDSVLGVMAWCPITSLDYADEAYEWNMGQYATTNTRASTTWTSALSDDLATEYGEYINQLGLKDPNGNTLTLTETTDGIYTAGSYYDYILSVIEDSLNKFLNDTIFPYTPSSSGGGPGGDVPSGPPSFNALFASSSTTYNTAEEYINSLNSDEQWINYNSATNTVKITSIESFVNHCKSATKSVGAFDDLSRSQAENNLFGNDASNYLHFDSVMADLLITNADVYASYSDYNSQYASDYASDLTLLDSLNNSIQYRVNMYNPMYYLCDYYDGYNTSNLAKYWRIHSGITQGDTALTVETNLYLALLQSNSVESVEFETVWNQGHTEAERTGSASTNFINWVNECLA